MDLGTPRRCNLNSLQLLSCLESNLVSIGLFTVSVILSYTVFSQGRHCFCLRIPVTWYLVEFTKFIDEANGAA